MIPTKLKLIFNFLTFIGNIDDKGSNSEYKLFISHLIYFIYIKKEEIAAQCWTEGLMNEGK